MDPVEVIRGGDPQLESGIQEVLRLMGANPKSLPRRPAPPIRRS